MWNPKLTKPRQQQDQSPDNSGQTPRLIFATDNLILASLSREVANKIASVSKPVHLNAGDMIYEGGDEIEHIYFPINSVISSVAILEDGSSVEICMIGREGLTGVSALIGGRKATHFTRVSASGAALRTTPHALAPLFAQNDEIHDALLRAYRNLFTQICQRSVCNVRHNLLQRLAVWLLMVSDRVGGKELPFTQEEIANRISVRRAGVSVAASMLQHMEAISYHRGRIVINDRCALEQSACECYQILHQEFTDAGGGTPLLVFNAEV